MAALGVCGDVSDGSGISNVTDISSSCGRSSSDGDGLNSGRCSDVSSGSGICGAMTGTQDWVEDLINATGLMYLN